MTDLHNHMLWGVDDGASTPADSRSMLAAFARLGYIRIACSPHLFHPSFPPPDPELLQARFRELEEIGRGMGLELLLWGEHYLSADLVDAMEAGSGQLGLLHGRFLLIELGAFTNLQHFGNLSFRLQLARITPVLAHPERYAQVERQWPQFQRIRDCGCLFQLNAASLAGAEGNQVKQRALRMIEEGLADLVASDAHSAEDLESFVPPALACVKQAFGPEVVRRLFSQNPGRIIQGAVPNAG
jgi:protein-tyrosine phosphatase